MANEPPVLLADEPTGNLDTKNADEVMSLMLEMIEANNSTMCLITHDESLAKQIADRVIVLRDGKLVSS